MPVQFPKVQFPMVRQQMPAPHMAKPARAAGPAGWQAPPRTNSIGPAPVPVNQVPVNAALAAGQNPQPTIRGQSPDAPVASPTSPFVLPTPQQLGLVPAQAAAALAPIDWNDLRTRLHKLGAVGFHLDQVGGQWRAQLRVPVNAQETRTLESSAASDAAAVSGALQQAESLVSQR
jgi:hypothetical protein